MGNLFGFGTVYCCLGLYVVGSLGWDSMLLGPFVVGTLCCWDSILLGLYSVTKTLLVVLIHMLLGFYVIDWDIPCCSWDSMLYLVGVFVLAGTLCHCVHIFITGL